METIAISIAESIAVPISDLPENFGGGLDILLVTHDYDGGLETGDGYLLYVGSYGE